MGLICPLSQQQQISSWIAKHQVMATWAYCLISILYFFPGVLSSYHWEICTQCKSALACLWVCLYLFVFQAGDAGVPGQQGSRGKRGPAGESGRKGRVGSKGVIGDGGPVGFQGPPGPPVSLKIQLITFVFLLYAMVGNSIKRKRLTTWTGEIIRLSMQDVQN